MDRKEELPDEAGSWAQEAFGVREEEGPRQSSADSPAVKAKGSLLMPSQLRMNRLPGGAAGGTCVFPAHDQAKSGLIAPLCLTAGRPWAFQMIRKNTHVHTAENNSHHRGKDFKRRTTTQKGAQEGTEFVQRQTPASEHLWLERGAQCFFSAVHPGWLDDDSHCLDSSSAPSASWLVILDNLADTHLSLLTHCCCSLDRLCQTGTPWTTARRASLSFTISPSLLRLMSIELVMPSNHRLLCRPLLLLP
ncbi:uncharacterized protein LOC122680676 isoform X3 [Cervus elaphus]|uniref:uncharacterized protein LOC122680676 isoform X3 n=1 Tax=Cervus elaphus TaxID=9860 RepID=UPI001CC2D53E|nr:uncharacterized protein LOC122680676 isoform X3 [Cervus elaphus]